jgi:hypothetical protein
VTQAARLRRDAFGLPRGESASHARAVTLARDDRRSIDVHLENGEWHSKSAGGIRPGKLSPTTKRVPEIPEGAPGRERGVLVTPFLKKLILSAAAAAGTFLLLKLVLHALLSVWWADVIMALVVGVLVYSNVSLAALQKAADDAKASLGIK